MIGGNFDLERFVTAQAPLFDTALAELIVGRKRTHWMWVIFPQLQALGHSPTAQFYGIGSLTEAQAYHAHPVLGTRLGLSTRTVLQSRARSLHEIFGSPDDLKFRSCMTYSKSQCQRSNYLGRRSTDGVRASATTEHLNCSSSVVRLRRSSDYRHMSRIRAATSTL